MYILGTDYGEFYAIDKSSGYPYLTSNAISAKTFYSLRDAVDMMTEVSCSPYIENKELFVMELNPVRVSQEIVEKHKHKIENAKTIFQNLSDDEKEILKRLLKA